MGRSGAVDQNAAASRCDKVPGDIFLATCRLQAPRGENIGGIARRVRVLDSRPDRVCKKFCVNGHLAKTQIKAREQNRKANPIEGLGTVAEQEPEPF